MAIESILAEIDAEIARLTQVRSLLARFGKVTALIVSQKNKQRAREEEEARAERRSAQAHRRCATQALGRTESQDKVKADRCFSG